MTLNDIFGIFAAIVTLAIVATIFTSKDTSGIISAWTGGFASDISAAKGTSNG
jgi:hypothetical protein